MSETLYDYPCSSTFREHERWWQGEGLYSEPREHFPTEHTPFPTEHTPSAPVQDFYLLGRMAYLQHQVESLKKTSHSHSYKKKTKYIVEG